MSEDWRVGFKQAMVDALMQNGSPLDPKEDGWGWIHPSAMEIRKETASFAVDYESTTWTDNWMVKGADTFHDGTRVELLDLTVRYHGHDPVVYRYVGGVSDLISAVINNAMEATQ